MSAADDLQDVVNPERLAGLTANQKQLLMLEAARTSFAAYVRLMFPAFERAQHHNRFIQVLHAVERGELNRTIVCMPPRHSKSTLGTEFFPAWYMGRNPTHQIILVAYGQKLADKFGRKVRNLLKNPIHEAVFPECKLATDSRSVQSFSTTAGGTIQVVGRGGSLTGHGAHLLVIDDPLKDRQEAYSEVIREALKEWFSTVAYTRLMPGGRIIITQTRWHEDDLVGHVLREHPHDNWYQVRMPAIAEEDEGWRNVGDALWPEWYPLVAAADAKAGTTSLENIRLTLGKRDWDCLYQQRPAGAEGGVFKYEWLDRAMYKEVSRLGLNVLILVDPATSKRETSDFTAMMVLGLAANRHVYLLDMVRDRLNLTERKQALFRLVQLWHPYFVGYEHYAATADVPYIKECMLREAVNFRIKALGTNKLRKEERIERLVPWFESGRLHFPRDMWRERIEGQSVDLVEEFRNDEYGVFPAGAHDDALDALSRMTDEDVPLNWPYEDDVASGGPYVAPAFARPVNDSWMTV